MQLDKLISEAEEIELRKIASNETAMQALKKVLLFSVYYSGMLDNDTDFQRNVFFSILLQPNTGQEYKLTNEELGQKFRARVEGLMLLDDGLKQLKSYRAEPEVEEEKANEAR